MNLEIHLEIILLKFILKKSYAKRNKENQRNSF